MNKPIITFDMDGVIARYVPMTNPSAADYYACTLDDPRIPNVLWSLSTRASIYIVSARRAEGVLDVTWSWLGKHGISRPWIAGVICQIPSKQKATFVNMMGSTLHFDDHPVVIRSFYEQHIYKQTKSVLVANEHPENQDIIKSCCFPSACGWGDIIEILKTHGVSTLPEQLRLYE
jgi:hypothetical protein